MPDVAAHWQHTSAETAPFDYTWRRADEQAWPGCGSDARGRAVAPDAPPASYMGPGAWGRGWFIGFIGVAARGYSLHAELGYGFDLGDHVVLVPRVRLRGPNISVDKFTDAVNARVSFEDIGRLIGGFGLTVHSTLPVDGGEIWLRGALDLWMAAIAGTASRSASV